MFCWNIIQYKIKYPPLVTLSREGLRSFLDRKSWALKKGSVSDILRNPQTFLSQGSHVTWGPSLKRKIAHKQGHFRVESVGRKALGAASLWILLYTQPGDFQVPK